MVSPRLFMDAPGLTRGGICYSLKTNYSQKNLPGVLKRKKKYKKFGRRGGVALPGRAKKMWRGEILGCLGPLTPPPGGRAGSENDILLPLTKP